MSLGTLDSKFGAYPERDAACPVCHSVMKAAPLQFRPSVAIIPQHMGTGDRICPGQNYQVEFVSVPKARKA